MTLKGIVKKLKVYKELGRFQKITLHRLEMLQYAFRYVKNEKVEGEYFEFGVARGLTFAGAYQVAKKYNVNISKFLAFDSFEGLPELGSVDKEFERFSAGAENWDKSEFLQILNDGDVNMDQVRIIEGWFDDTLNDKLEAQMTEADLKASVIWVDCDLYKSTVPVLKFIKRFLQDGTVVIFDDWFCYHARPDKGEQLALSEFIDENPEFSFIPYKNFGVVGKSFIVNKNERK